MCNLGIGFNPKDEVISLVESKAHRNIWRLLTWYVHSLCKIQRSSDAFWYIILISRRQSWVFMYLSFDLLIFPVAFRPPICSEFWGHYLWPPSWIRDVTIPKLELSVRGQFYQHGLTLIPAWISNHIYFELWDEITYPFLNFNGCTVEV